MRFSEIIPSKVNMLYAPVLVNDEELRRGIMREPYFLRSYEVIQSCTVAMLGIAEIKNLSFPQIKQIRPYVPPEAVGEICTRLFDKDGKILKTKIDDRTLAIAPEDLCKIPLRVGVAGMTYKTEAILGALRGQLINALITDTAIAAKLLEA
jgi:deoxyribonucleoside regulator